MTERHWRHKRPLLKRDMRTKLLFSKHTWRISTARSWRWDLAVNLNLFPTITLWIERTKANLFSFLLGEGTGDWNFVCCPWEKEARWICTDISSTHQCWMSSTLSAALHSKWTGKASPRAGPVSCWAAGQNRGYVWLLKQQQCWKVRVHCFLLIAEVTKLKMQLEVPGLAGTYTNATDRKLEEGQKVSSHATSTSYSFSFCAIVLRLLFLSNRTCVSCAQICRDSVRTCSLVKEPAVATQEERSWDRRWPLQMRH